MHHAVGTHQAEGYQHRAHRLGSHSRDGHACHIHVEADDQDEVQHHIHHTGDGQVNQRTLGIAHGAQDGGAEVIHHIEGHAQEVDLHVGGGQIQDGVVHHLQQGPAEEEANQTHGHTGDDRQGHGRMHSLMHRRRIICAEGLCHRDAAAHAQADEHIDHQVDQTAGGAHCSQAFLAGPAAHDYHVRRVEEQLQNTRCNQRQGKDKDLGQQCALGHVHFVFLDTCHIARLLCITGRRIPSGRGSFPA